ncbi:hypothetical protein DIPPA_09708 [Diplonema papillatum]|nr:hypothetical protein DIPPA_09708 [Diplonema papillatum]|eukprot:gene15373-23502_t
MPARTQDMVYRQGVERGAWRNFVPLVHEYARLSQHAGIKSVQRYTAAVPEGLSCLPVLAAFTRFRVAPDTLLGKVARLQTSPGVQWTPSDLGALGRCLATIPREKAGTVLALLESLHLTGKEFADSADEVPGDPHRSYVQYLQGTVVAADIKGAPLSPHCLPPEPSAVIDPDEIWEMEGGSVARLCWVLHKTQACCASPLMATACEELADRELKGLHPFEVGIALYAVGASGSKMAQRVAAAADGSTRRWIAAGSSLRNSPKMLAFYLSSVLTGCLICRHPPVRTLSTVRALSLTDEGFSFWKPQHLLAVVQGCEMLGGVPPGDVEADTDGAGRHLVLASVEDELALRAADAGQLFPLYVAVRMQAAWAACPGAAPSRVLAEIIAERRRHLPSSDKRTATLIRPFGGHNAAPDPGSPFQRNSGPISGA